MRPRDFWRMTIREWRCAVKGYGEKIGVKEGEEPLSRAELDELMKQYPDEPAASTDAPAEA